MKPEENGIVKNMVNTVQKCCQKLTTIITKMVMKMTMAIINHNYDEYYNDKEENDNEKIYKVENKVKKVIISNVCEKRRENNKTRRRI